MIREWGQLKNIMSTIENKYSSHPLRKWFIKQSLDHPIRSIIVSLIATISVGSGVLSFMIDDDMMKLLPADLDSKIAWDEIQDEFGSTELIYIAFGEKGKSVFNSKTFADMWDLSKTLESTDQIEEVFSLVNTNRIDNVDDFMEVDDLQTKRDLTQAEVDDIQNYLLKNPSLKKRFISENDEYFVITAQPYSNEQFDVFSKIVVDKSDEILDGYEIHYGGNAYISGIMP